jgi:hypothetical protein
LTCYAAAAEPRASFGIVSLCVTMLAGSRLQATIVMQQVLVNPSARSRLVQNCSNADEELARDPNQR